jgi:hypothetical protein
MEKALVWWALGGADRWECQHQADRLFQRHACLTSLSQLPVLHRASLDELQISEQPMV